MQPDDSDKSLGDGGTFAGEPKRERAEVSLGDEATFAGAARRRVADASLGDERTLGGEAAAGLDSVIDDIEVVDLEARYKPEGTLGRGGMGEVLLALDTRLGRKVAIKRILGEAARSKTAVSRFLTEAKAIAAISHPNVVQIYDYGRAKDGPFLIMEYVDGSNLLDRCRDGALPLEEAVDLACQLCDGLAKAHDLGIVHRDIKPANVLLTKDGLPKLTDFGLAKAEAADHQMTMTGAVLGTPDFMPPEQRRDAALVDARSDLWSLAATLYQMVTGRSPKIIRFDLLPAVLTQVLGKALEEAKEDRFQTARELRDALKASLVAAAPAVAELGEGQCPACGVKNDSSRRFCRGCGESLEAPCLSCAKPMPMWEEICGQCGTKQAPLLETRRGEMAAQQAEAEGLLKEYGFEHAEQITVTLRDEADPRLKQLTPWATAFLPKIAAARDAQLSQAVAALIEALKHEASFDYPSAIHALEQVPEILRSRPLGGQAETVAAVLARVATKQAEVERLELLVKARISAKELGGLLTEVRKLQGLRPDRTDVDKLCTQLEERQQKLVVHRDEALKLAQAHLDAKDYESVIAVLRKVDRSVETPEVGQLRDAANVNIKCLQELMREISQAVSLKQLDGLMPRVQTALSLRPGHPELLKLLDSLRVREAKVAAGIQDVVSQADEAFKACRFDKAVALLHRIPEERRSSEVTDLLDRYDYLAMTKAGVISGIEGLPKEADLAKADGLDLSGLATRGRSYLGQIAAHGLADPAIEQWCVRCETAAERREAAEEAERLAKANLRRILVRAGFAVAAIVLVVAGLAIRSSWRSAAIQAALATRDWQTVLELDPENVLALVGVANAKLTAKSPDIDGAFNVLERAAKISPGSAEVKVARGAAHAMRATACAREDRLAEATRELTEATGLNAAPQFLSIGREAIAAAWMARAEAALGTKDAATARSACDFAFKVGAPIDRVNQVRARALLIESLSLVSSGDPVRAAARAAEASLIDPVVAGATLNQPANIELRQAVVADYQRKVADALAGDDWDSALRIAAAAGTLDRSASEWLEVAIATHPGGLSRVSEEVLRSMPVFAFANLSPEVVVELPPISNTVGIDFKLLPPGTFAMGENAKHQVTLTKAYYIGVREVTIAQWKRVMESAPSRFPTAPSGADERPVEGIEWDEAMAFCAKLSELPDERKAGHVYRLPTEAEWEYACRAGTTTRYSFGDDESRLSEYGWFSDETSGNRPSLVGRKKPNRWRLHDMHGNVWELCSDWYGEYGRTSLTDPVGPATGTARVVRGGSCVSPAGWCASGHRQGYRGLGRTDAGKDPYDPVGLRLILDRPGSNQPHTGVP